MYSTQLIRSQAREGPKVATRILVNNPYQILKLSLSTWVSARPGHRLPSYSISMCQKSTNSQEHGLPFCRGRRQPRLLYQHGQSALDQKIIQRAWLGRCAVR